MSRLAAVTTGKLTKPFNILIYGPPGVGKSTLASNAPNPIFLDIEQGTDQLATARLTPKTFADVLADLSALTVDKHDYKTLAIDSVDHLEPLVWDETCRLAGKQDIEEFGYKAGYQHCLTQWRQYFDALELLREKRGMHTIQIGHSHIKAVDDPAKDGKSYQQHKIKLHEKAAALFIEKVSAILFATYEVFVMTDDKTKKNVAKSTGGRIVYSEWRPAFTAKNRLGLPFSFPLSWEEFERHAKAQQPVDPVQMQQTIAALLTQVTDKTLVTKITQATQAASPQKLAQIQNQLEVIVNAQAA